MKFKKLKIVLLSCFGLYNYSQAKDSTPINIFVDENRNFDFFFEILDSTKAKHVTFEEVLHDTTLTFHAIKQDNKLMKPGRKYWIRFDIDNRSDKSLFLHELRYLDIEIFYPNELNIYHSKKISVKDGILNRPFVFNDLIFSIAKQKGVKRYYATFTSHVPVGLAIYMTNENFIFNKGVSNTAFYFFFLGIIISAMLFAIMLFIRFRTKMYFYYLSYIVCLILYSLTTWNFLEPINFLAKLNYFPETLYYVHITIFLLLYSREFLESKQNYPIWDKLIVSLVAFRLISFYIGYIFNINFLFYPIIDAISLFPSCIVGLMSYKNGLKYTRFYIISFFIIFLGYIYHTTVEKMFFFRIFNNVESLKYFLDNSYVFFYFIILELGLFTIALVEYFIHIKKQIQIEQSKTILYLNKIIQKEQENAQIRENINRELEEKVAIRTIELQNANSILQSQGQEINRINELLTLDNEKLSHDVELLKNARLMEENVSLEEFLLTFPDDNAVMSFLAELKWSVHYYCRKCNYKKFYVGQTKYSRKCKSCGYDESPTSHTLLEGTRISLVKALYIVYACHSFKSLNITKLSEILNLRIATCHHFATKVKETFSTHKISKNDKSNWSDFIVGV